ncbi:MAG: hypothetical protein LAO76_21550 [Acidobacteriia bacterium]|nr:hypothetical protein [Terriglobia bacterium]
MYVLGILAISLSLFLSEGTQADNQPANPDKHSRGNVNIGDQVSTVTNFSPCDDRQGETSKKYDRAAQEQPRLLGLTAAEWVQDVITLFLAIITALYVRITSGILKETKEQSAISTAQLRLMEGGVHVDNVRTAAELAESNMQVFFVTVVNSGLTAKRVSMTMEVDLAGNTTKYQGSIAMMVPANGKRDFSITSHVGISAELLQRLDGDTLRVRGRIAWDDKTEDYCYKYNRCPLVPVPEGFPKFVPCDFDTRMAVSIGGRSDGTSTGSGTLTALKNPPDETKQT